MAASSLLLPILCALACSCSLSLAHSTSPETAAGLRGSCPGLLTVGSPRSAPPDSGGGVLLLAVPWKLGFEKFISFSPANCSITGFSVNVFQLALPHLQDTRLQSFRFVLVGDGTETPSYNEMIEMVREKRVDGLVGDFTITRDRSEKVGFTLPYLASKLVMIAPARYADQWKLWGFLMPFSKQLWGTLLACFMVTGLSLYFLENKNPDFIKTSQSKEGDSQHAHGGPSMPPSDESTYAPLRVRSIQDNYNHLLVQDASSLQRPGPPIYDQASHRRQFLNAYWFTSLCIFQSQQESVRTHLGRIVTGTWLFAMLIFNAGYTASLASLLSSHKRYPTIGGFQSLLRDRHITVGCQEGSFMENYMKKLNLKDHTIKKFNSTQQYVEALEKGNDNKAGVGAVLEESPYIRELVQSHCDLMQSSRDDDYLPSFGGLGFAFRHGDVLIDNVSKIILQMGSNGTLKKLRENWQIDLNPTRISCPSHALSRLGFKSFEGLFFVVSAVYLICVINHLLKRKAIKSRKQGCALSCTQDESAVDLQAGDFSLIRGKNGACDALQGNQSSL